MRGLCRGDGLLCFLKMVLINIRFIHHHLVKRSDSIINHPQESLQYHIAVEVILCCAVKRRIERGSAIVQDHNFPTTTCRRGTSLNTMHTKLDEAKDEDVMLVMIPRDWAGAYVDMNMASRGVVDEMIIRRYSSISKSCAQCAV